MTKQEILIDCIKCGLAMVLYGVCFVALLLYSMWLQFGHVRHSPLDIFFSLLACLVAGAFCLAKWSCFEFEFRCYQDIIKHPEGWKQ